MKLSCYLVYVFGNVFIYKHKYLQECFVFHEFQVSSTFYFCLSVRDGIFLLFQTMMLISNFTAIWSETNTYKASIVVWYIVNFYKYFICINTFINTTFFSSSTIWLFLSALFFFFSEGNIKISATIVDLPTSL